MPRKPASWYALCVHPEYPEKDVQKDIKRQARLSGVGGVGKIVLARHKETREVGGKAITHRVKSFPGYLILSLTYCTEVQVLLDSVRGVVGLLPLRLDGGDSRPKPTALGSREAVELLLRQELARKEKKSPYASAEGPSRASGPVERTAVVGLEKGDEVLFTGGPFSGFAGVVSKVLNRSEVAVSVVFMGKATTKVVSEYDLQRN